MNIRSNCIAICTLLLAAVSPVHGAELNQDELAKRIADCNAISAGEERLECFDAIAEIQSSTTTPEEIAEQSAPADGEPIQSTASDPEPASSGAVAAAATTTATAADSMGGKYLKSEETDQSEPDKSLDMLVVGTSKDVYGRWVFEFDNGQVWRQSSKKHVTMPKDLPATATIHRGFLGAHSLRFGDGGSRISVKRDK